MYYCLPKLQLNRLHHTQNALALAVVAAPRSSNTDHILRSLHLLKVQERIEYKIVSTTRYLRDLITVQPSRFTRSCIGQWSLSTTIASLHTALFGMLHLIIMWNKLPPILFVFLVSLVHHYHPALILDRLLTFLVAFSTLVSKPSFSQSQSIHNHIAS